MNFIKNFITQIVDSFKQNLALAITKVVLIGLIIISVFIFCLINFAIAKTNIVNLVLMGITGVSAATFAIIKIVETGKKQ
jgi:hypothetical protein